MKRRVITKEELEVILRNHKLWLANNDDGERANLERANLKGADLEWSNLERANLKGADFEGANLKVANLNGADLSLANLRWSDLQWANLDGADLNGSDLQWANLNGANLNGADLKGAKLKWAKLYDADLNRADLEGADLDYSVIPLWCGSLYANFDDKQLTQIAYHLVKAGLNSNNASEETKTELAKLIDFANKFHRVKKCGAIEKEAADERAD